MLGNTAWDLRDATFLILLKDTPPLSLTEFSFGELFYVFLFLTTSANGLLARN